MSPYVTLHYGPYEANGVIRHKIQRIRGVIRALTKLGFEIEVVPSVHINRLSVEMLGREIYRCDIRNLMFNMEYDDDPNCRKLVSVVKDAAEKFYSDDNVPKFCLVQKKVGDVLGTKRGSKMFSSSIQLWFEIPKCVSRDLVYQIGESASGIEQREVEFPEIAPYDE